MTIIPKVILWSDILMIQNGILSSLNYFIPNYDLIQLITRRLILGCEVEKQLFHVPVEEWAEVSLEVKYHETHIILLTGCTVVWNISTVTKTYKCKMTIHIHNKESIITRGVADAGFHVQILGFNPPEFPYAHVTYQMKENFVYMVISRGPRNLHEYFSWHN